MSMLTPPGMGGKKYRVTGDRYPRMRPPRRRRRTVALALSTVAVLGLVGTGTLQLIRVFSAEAEGEGPQRAAASGARECATERPETEAEGASGPLAELPEPRTITVNVYNATTRTGLAQQTADALAERGFVIGTVDNAPEELDGKVEAPGLLLGAGEAQENGALAVVGAQLAGAEQAEADAADARDTPEVDLVIGEGFQQLTAPQDAARALEALQKPDRETETAGQEC
ncbi:MULTISPECIES: LytR C-terminal domain-containing protein [Streptomyces]|uniref:LytR C-terminal domain-containing protein n=1 Tax=Streptomyces TaxID=1883 RepID=UPI0009977D3C|nr:LytR C-terminal domain-containing protein [Streptomyces ginkgonis]